MRRLPLIAMPALALAALLAMPGCQKTTRVVDIGEATRDELAAGKLLPTAIIEFSDRSARQLALDLESLERINEMPGDSQARIVLGDLNNQTRDVSSNDFELLVRRFRSRLINSNAVYDNLNFVTERARTSAINRRENVVGADGAVGSQDAYRADQTFTLLGDFLQISRGDTSLYYLELQLVSLANNEIIWSDTYDVKQMLTEE